MSIDITVKSNLGAFQKHFKDVVARFPRSIDAAVGNAGQKTSKVIKRATPKQSGALSKSIKSFKTGSRLERIVESRGSPEKYVDAVEVGTGLFGPKKKLIKPKSKKALRWISLKKRPIKGKRKGGGSQGNVVFAKSVKGFKGFFMFKKAAPRALRLLKVEVIKKIKQLAADATRFKTRLT